MIEHLKRLKPLHPIETGYPEQLQQLSGIKAVVFDIYGTLLVSGSGDIESLNPKATEAIKSLEEAGVNFSENLQGEDILKQFRDAVFAVHAELKLKGIPFPEVDIVDIWARILNNLQQQKFISHKENIDLKELAVIYELKTNPVYPMPEMVKTIEKLQQEGYKLGIVSNAQYFTPTILNYFLGEEKELAELKFFDQDLCVYSYQLQEAKPSQKLYQIINAQAAKKEIQPHEILFIGNDMLNDIYPSSLCGMRTCLFAGDQRSLRLRQEHKEIDGLKPDVVIRRLTQLFDILK